MKFTSWGKISQRMTITKRLGNTTRKISSRKISMLRGNLLPMTRHTNSMLQLTKKALKPRSQKNLSRRSMIVSQNVRKKTNLLQIVPREIHASESYTKSTWTIEKAPKVLRQILPPKRRANPCQGYWRARDVQAKKEAVSILKERKEKTSSLLRFL